jgi:hypothetical protein
MTTKNDDQYEFDKPHPGESMDAYLKRHKAHPADKDARKATPAEHDLHDETEKYADQAFVITKK